jgi:hypothetical protein
MSSVVSEADIGKIRQRNQITGVDSRFPEL